PTEELSIDLSGPGSAVIKGGSSAKLSAPKSSTKLTGKSDSGKNLANPGVGDSSEFELSLDADSSDFDLQMNAHDSSDEVALGEMPKAPKAGSGKRAGEGGINLRSPADSGISLEKNKGKAPAGDDVDFELSLEGPMPGGSGAKIGGPKSGPKSGKNKPVTSD